MKKAFFSIALAALTVASCSRYNDDSTPIPNQEQTNPNLKTVANLDASNMSPTAWTYFSFETGQQVKVTNPETELTWDIAFNRYNIRTNSGTSGAGQVGVFNTLNTNFNAVTEIPSTASYTPDSMVEMQSIRGTVRKSLNPVITGTVMDNNSTGWYNYTNKGDYTLSQNVYIVKTLSGKFVKLQLTSYKNSVNNTTGFITFKYQVADSNNKF